MSRFRGKVNATIDPHLSVPDGDEYVRVSVTGKPMRRVNVPVVPLILVATFLLIFFFCICPAILAAIPHAPAGVLLLGI